MCHFWFSPLPSTSPRLTSSIWSPDRRPLGPLAMLFCCTIDTKIPTALPPMRVKPRFSDDPGFFRITNRGSDTGVGKPSLDLDLRMLIKIHVFYRNHSSSLFQCISLYNRIMHSPTINIHFYYYWNNKKVSICPNTDSFTINSCYFATYGVLK